MGGIERINVRRKRVKRTGKPPKKEKTVRCRGLPHSFKLRGSLPVCPSHRLIPTSRSLPEPRKFSQLGFSFPPNRYQVRSLKPSLLSLPNFSLIRFVFCPMALEF
ncbi:hypothetical protein ACFX2H_022043 [Malus domestica]